MIILKSLYHLQYFSIKMYAVGTHKDPANKAILKRFLLFAYVKKAQIRRLIEDFAFH